MSAELFSHYDAVLLSSLLDTMENILYCPRPACQYPVILEPGENMATCPSCAYAFCIHCKMVYHGIEPCRLRSCEYSCLFKFILSVFSYLFCLSLCFWKFITWHKFLFKDCRKSRGLGLGSLHSGLCTPYHNNVCSLVQ